MFKFGVQIPGPGLPIGYEQRGYERRCPEEYEGGKRGLSSEGLRKVFHVLTHLHLSAPRLPVTYVFVKMEMKPLNFQGTERKGLKRKLADAALGEPGECHRADVRKHVLILKEARTGQESHRLAARTAAHALAELAKHGKTP